MTALDSTWRKSSKSGDNGACVEVRFTGELIEVRDTKNRTGGQLSFTPEDWRAFTSGVKHLEFERPA